MIDSGDFFELLGLELENLNLPGCLLSQDEIILDPIVFGGEAFLLPLLALDVENVLFLFLGVENELSGNQQSTSVKRFWVLDLMTVSLWGVLGVLDRA